MPVEAVAGGEQSHDRRNPRQPSDQKHEQQASGAEVESSRHREPKLLVHGEAKVILDADHQVIKVQLISLKDGWSVEEIAKAELAARDYHGILVDIDT